MKKAYKWLLALVSLCLAVSFLTSCGFLNQEYQEDDETSLFEQESNDDNEDEDD